MDLSPDGRGTMSNIGLPEIAIVLLIVLVIFGPKRLPQLGRSLGSGMREFKDAVTGKNKGDDDDIETIGDAASTREPTGAPPEPPPADRVTTAAPDDSSATRAKAADAS